MSVYQTIRATLSFLFTQSCLTLCNPWTAAHQASLSFTISQSLLKLMSIESVMPSNHLILYHPLLLLTSIFPRVRVFSNELALCIKCQKYWQFSFSISPSFPDSSDGKEFTRSAGDPVQFLGWEDPLRSDRLRTSVFWGFLCGSAGKESSCNEGDLGSNPWVGKIPWSRER